MSLYRKYRPRSFASLVGQDHIRVTLVNALKTGNVHHAYLFTGPRGTGKTSAARLMAKSINCLNFKDGEPCDSCDICRDTTDGHLIDLIEIDAASNRGIDEMRDLKEKIIFAPTRAKNKVYIIDEVHMLTKEAFNALLKTLEEPPANVFFILATTEAHKVPATILSRCQRFDFRRISETVLMEKLKAIAKEEQIETEEEALEGIARYSMGGMRDAIVLLEQLTVDGKLNHERVRDVLGLSSRDAIAKLFDLLQKKQTQAALDHVEALYMNGQDLSQFNKDFLWFLRQKMIEGVNSCDNAAVSGILNTISIFQAAYEQLRFAIIPQLPLEIAIVETCMSIKNKQPETDEKTVPVGSVEPKINTSEMAGQDELIGLSGKITAKSVAAREHQSVKAIADILSLEQLQKQWPKIMKQLSNAIARRILSSGTILALERNIITIGFKNKFDLDKLNEPAHRLALESALFAVFQLHFKVVAVLETGQNSSKIDENAAKIMELFGGEFIEDGKL